VKGVKFSASSRRPELEGWREAEHGAEREQRGDGGWNEFSGQTEISGTGFQERDYRVLVLFSLFQPFNVARALHRGSYP